MKKKLSLLCLTLLIALSSVALTYTIGFKDVTNNKWYWEDVHRVSDYGIMNGFKDGTFKPNDNVTRAELSAIIVNTIEYMEKDYESRISNEIDTILSTISSTVHITANNGETFGSGVFISERGRILTAYHVIKGNDIVKINRIGGSQLQARVVEYSEEYDLAVLQVDGTTELFDYIEMSEYSPLLLDRVYVIGNPFNLRNTVSSGFVSRTGNNQLQMDISINSGNSGGAILNSNGKLVGIALSIIDPSKGSGIGFGATLEQIKNFIKDYQ